MNRELVGMHFLLFTGFTDQSGGELGTLAVCEQPTDRIPAEDVQNHIQVIPGSLARPRQQGDIPRPDLAGSRGDQLRLVVLRMLQLVSTFTNLLIVMQDSIHGSRGTVITVPRPVNAPVHWAPPCPCQRPTSPCDADD